MVLDMSSSDKSSLRDKLKDEEYTIEVKETIRQGKKLALNKPGERTLTKEENEELREYMNRYKDLIIEIEEIGSELEGFDRAWTLGKLMIEAKEEAEADGEDFSFEALVPAISAFDFSGSLAYRYRLLYQMFPDGGYDSKFSHTTMAELAQRAESFDEAREIYQRIVEAEIRPTERQVRAWADSTEDLDSIVEFVIKRTDNNHVESVRNVCILHGLSPVPSDKTIEKKIEAWK